MRDPKLVNLEFVVGTAFKIFAAQMILGCELEGVGKTKTIDFQTCLYKSLYHIASVFIAERQGYQRYCHLSAVSCTPKSLSTDCYALLAFRIENRLTLCTVMYSDPLVLMTT